MSGGLRCRCGQRHAWRVAVRRGNYSAFSGGRFTPSAYSELWCCRPLGGCGAVWRTSADYVNRTPDLKPGDESYGIASD